MILRKSERILYNDQVIKRNFMGLGVGEIFLIVAALVIFVGPKKIPELARSLGKMMNEFNQAKNGLINEVVNVDPKAEKAKIKVKDDLIIPSLDGAMLSQAKPPISNESILNEKTNNQEEVL